MKSMSTTCCSPATDGARNRIAMISPIPPGETMWITRWKLVAYPRPALNLPVRAGSSGDAPRCCGGKILDQQNHWTRANLMLTTNITVVDGRRHDTLALGQMPYPVNADAC